MSDKHECDLQYCPLRRSHRKLLDISDCRDLRGRPGGLPNVDTNGCKGQFSVSKEYVNKEYFVQQCPECMDRQ